MSEFADELCNLALKSLGDIAGKIYGQSADLSIGAGVLYKDTSYASYDSETERFKALQGMFLVLTHECDVANERDFNEFVVGVPLIFIEDFAHKYQAASRMDEARSLIVNVCKGNVNQLYYLPPPSPLVANVQALRLGALVYLNAMCSNHLKQFGDLEQNRVCALSEQGLEYADNMLRRHLFRPKADQLSKLA